MQAETLSIQATLSGQGIIPIIPPSRCKKRTKITARTQSWNGVARSASMASMENVHSAKLSQKATPEASTLPPVPRFPRQSTAPALPTIEIANDLEEMSYEDLRKLLISALHWERELIEGLNVRLRLLSSAIKRLEPTASVSLQDIAQLADVFHEINSSLAHTCQVESELGIRQRELEKRNVELSMLKRRTTSQTAALQQTQAENRLLKEKFRELQDEHAHLIKVNATEKQKIAQFFSKLDALHDGMQALTANTPESQFDTVSKLKGSINALLKELQDEKSEVAHKNKHIAELDLQIQRLNKKALRLTYKLNEIRNRKTTVVEQHLPQSEDLSKRQMMDPRTLQYRVDDLPLEHRTLFNELMEHGTQALSHVQESSRTTVMEVLGDKLLQLNEFVDQLHLIRPALESICKSSDTHSLITAVGNELSLIANSEHCFYWIFDRTNDEVWTLRNGQEVKFRSDLGLVGKALKLGVYLNETDPRSVEPMELGTPLQSALVYPVVSADQSVVGVAEIINNFAGKFDADEEYLVEMVLPAIAQTTVRALSASTAVRINRMKEELLKAVPTLSLCANKRALGSQAETLGALLFGVEKCKVMLVEGQAMTAPKDGSQVGREMGICGDVSKTLVAEIVGDPYNDIRYNSIVDLASTLPVYFVPVLGTVKGETAAIAVLQIPQKSAVKARVNDRSVRVDGGVAAVVTAFVSILSALLQRLL